MVARHRRAVCFLPSASLACLLIAGLSMTPEPVAAQKGQPLCQTGCIVYSTDVEPHGGSVTRPPNSGPYTATFTVYNTSTPNGTTDTYTFSCGSDGGISCESVSPQSATLSSGPGNGPVIQSHPSKGGAQAAFHVGAAGAAYPTSVEVQVTYTVGSLEGTLYLAANGYFSSDQGWYTVTIAAPAGPPTVALRNQNGDNVDRSLCLTSGASQAAGWECGDLVVTHGLPGYATLGRERSLTLLYNSAQAVPRPIVAASVNEGAVSQPTSVFVRLSINGSPRDSATYNGWSSAPTTRQVVLAHDPGNDTTGVYPFTLLVRNQYPGGNYDATASGNLIVVDRSRSDFGAGWSLVGVEQLVFNQPVGAPNGSVLWVGGDGSAKLYAPAGTNTWVAPPGAYRDTLTYDGIGTYTRTLRHRIQVKFDANGHHIQTVNRVGQQTIFTWTGSPARLTSIQVPPGVTGTTYMLTYDGNGKLDKLTDPANRVLDATVVSGRLTSLLDPDAVSTGFAYDAAGRMTGRTNRRNYTTSFVYAKGVRVDTVKVPLDPANLDTATTWFQPWDENGLAAGNGSSGNVAVDTAVAYTKIDGPRIDVADTAEFWIDRWGAPVKVRDPLGYVTSLARGDGNNPALVTRVQFPDGRILGAVYNTRGNLQSVTDSTYQGTGTTQPVTTSYVYGDANVPDSPTSIRGPVDTTLVAYDPSLGLATLFTAQGGHRTAFQYFTSGATRGLLSTVTDSAVSVVDTMQWTKSSQHLITQFAYDAWGNDSVITSPKNVKTEILRDSYRRPRFVRDPMRHRTDYAYDLLNRIDTVKVYDDTLLNGPKLTQYFYSPTGTIDTVLDPRLVMRRWTYDAADRPITMIDDMGNTEYRYFNRGGLLDSLKTRLSHVIKNTYDAAGRLRQTTYPARSYLGKTMAGDTIVRSYDAVGRLFTAENRNSVDTLQYNPEGTVRSERQIARWDDKSILFDVAMRSWYDIGGRRVTFFTGKDTLYYGYGADARLAKMKVAWLEGGFQPDSFLFTSDALGRRDRIQYTNGTDVTFGYDADGNLRMVCSKHPGSDTGVLDALEQRVVYSALNADGLVLGMEHWTGAAEGSSCGNLNGNKVESMSGTVYDARHELLSSAGSPVARTFRYDSSGNVIYKNDVDQNVDSFTVVARSNRVQGMVRNGQAFWTYNHDVNGARFEDRPPNTLDGWIVRYYNAVGQLLGDSVYVSPGGWQIDPNHFRYDALGRRVKEGGLYFAFDDPNVMRATGTYDWRYVHGPGVDDPLVAIFRSGSSYTRYYYLTDGRGRLLAFTDDAGYSHTGDQVYWQTGGNQAGAIGNSNSYVNTRAESPQAPRQSFYRNRYYDQQTGRFTEEDPIGVAGGLNLYQYAGNNPASFTDPFGLCSKADNWTNCKSWTAADARTVFTQLGQMAPAINHEVATFIPKNVAAAAAGLALGSVVAAVGRVSGALAAAKAAEASGEFGSVAVASEAEANVAARVWAGAGSRVITASHGGASATGEVVGRIAADGARVARFAAPKVNGTVAANLENVLTGSNMHVVVEP